MNIDPAIRMQGARRLLAWIVGILLVVLAAAFLGHGAWVVIALVGVVFAAIGMNRLWTARSARSWPQIDAVVLATSIKQHVEPGKYSSSVYYYPEVHLLYEVLGSRYEVSAYAVVRGDFRSSKRAETEELVSRYRAGDTVQAYVSPRNPRRAVLLPEMSAYASNSSWALFLSGLIVLALAIGAGIMSAL